MRGKGKRILVLSMIIFGVILTSIYTVTTVNDRTKKIDSEILRSMNYAQLTEEGKKVENTDFVEFSAYFTRDLNGDGNAEELLGTCRNVNDTDKLFIDLNVLTNGYLKNGKITINSTNFNYSMAMPKDRVLKNNYISNNVKVIELNQVQAGTQELILGDIIAYIGNNINNYSKTSTITLTGTHVSDENVETQINKTIELTVDWHGETKAKFAGATAYYNYDELDTETVSFSFTLDEIQKELILKENIATITIPELNGYAPTEVKCTNSNVESEYNDNTKVFTIKRTSKCNDEGIITSNLSRSNTYTVNVTYPKEAYDTISSYTELTIPIEGYYTGYNNINEEFTNPYQSNIVNGKIKIIFREKPKGSIYNFYVDFVDKQYVSSPIWDYVISKQDILNLYDKYNEENEKQNSEEVENKEYVIRWRAVRGSEGEVSSMIMSETKENNTQENPYGDKWSSTIMENYVTNTGIYFEGADKILEENGTISVYNNETNELIHTFTKEEWNIYTRENPYKYENEVRHVRVETSKTNLNSSLSVYHIKELETAKILKDFTKEQVKDVERIYTYLTGICNIEGQSAGIVNDIDSVRFVSEKSNSQISVQTQKIPTQEILNNQKIYIDTLYKTGVMAKWENGKFLVEIPKEIINMNIKNIYTNNNNVKIVAYDLYKKDDRYFIKIITENEEPITAYRITIDCTVAPDPRVASSNKQIRLYDYNQYCNEYYYEIQDVYDVDSDNNIQEKIGTATTDINLLSPTSLITLETITNYDNMQENEITIAPNIAEVNRKNRETREATINVSLSNNYPYTVSGVQILGKIPFEGNRYVLNQNELGSEFTTTMKEQGLTIPEELKEKTVVYYSENENPNKKLDDITNGWTLKENVKDFSKIKTYLIDISQYTMQIGKTYTFNYTINIPEDISYNLVSYSDHAVYFELDTDGGKLQRSTEPNKVGIRISRKYELELTKTKKGFENLKVPGATYKVEYIDVEGNERTRILTTDSNGNINMDELYVGITYKIKEFKAPNNYVLNDEMIEFKVVEDELGRLKVETTNEENVILDEESEKVIINTQDEPKYNITITKTDRETGERLSNVRFIINGTTYDTNREGQITVSGLLQNKEYKLVETKAEGYYLIDTITFKLVKDNEGNLKIESDSEAFNNATIQNTDEEDLIQISNINITNEKIPTYNLQILKVEEDLKEKDVSKLIPLQNAKFKLIYQDLETEKIFSTDKTGKINITDLYQYVDGKYITGNYILKEIQSPEGYSNNAEEINFKVIKNAEDKLDIQIKNEEELTSIKDIDIEEDTIKMILQDKPLFTLTKTDAETGEPLANAKFTIYETDANKNIIGYAKDVNESYVGEKNEKGEYVITTDENGTIVLALKGGSYKIVEVEFPEGYQENTNEEYFNLPGGEGPKINSIEDLVEFSNDVNNGNNYSGITVRLMRSLDFNDASSYRNPSNLGQYKLDPIGKSETYYFSGVFDGQGNEIKNFKKEDYYTSYGLFGYVIDGKIKDVGVSLSSHNTTDQGYMEQYAGGIAGYIKNSTIINCYSTGYMRYLNTLGGIVGYAIDGSEIINCYHTGYIESVSGAAGNYGGGSSKCGGIAGYLGNGSSIRNCYNNGYMSNASQNYDAGGIVAQMYGSDILNCYSNSDIRNSYGGNTTIYNRSNTTIGGIAGRIVSSNINNCYNTGYIANNNAEGNTNESGGIVGYRGDTVKINNCYYSSSIVGKTINYNGQKINDSEMKTKSFYNNLNLDGVWLFQEGTPPILNTSVYTQEITSINIKNTLKRFNITTEIALNSKRQREGGTITGVYNDSYKQEDNIKYIETVIYNNHSTQSIEIKPQLGYRIDKITINKIELDFTTDESGNVILPVEYFKNIKEDKHIVVKFEENPNLIIHKVDEDDSNIKLSNVKFKIEYNTNEDNNESIEVKTNSNGEAKVRVPFNTNIKITEINTPKGYIPKVEPVELQVNDTEIKEITITNKKVDNKIVINKKDKNTNEPIPNTKFVIYSIDEENKQVDFAKDYNDNYLGIKEDEKYVLTTDENGQISVRPKPGMYKAVELEAAKGYFLDEEEYLRTSYFKIEETVNYIEDQEKQNITDTKTPDLIINNIEDLVRLSNEVNSGTTYEGKTIELARTLDFNEDSSYNNPNDTSFGDYNGDGTTEGIKAELTTGGRGLKTIGEESNMPFKGTFDGNGYEIRNMLIYNRRGLFGYIKSGKILNLGLNGGGLYSSEHKGAFVYTIEDGEINNCYSNITIVGGESAGIVHTATNSIISSCYNTRDINVGPGCAGVVYHATNSTISNCYNTGNISGGAPCGGIVYDLVDSTVNNCYNTGTVNNGVYSGGIVGYNARNSKIINCRNEGNISGSQGAGGIVGCESTNSDIVNCYNTGEIISNNSSGGSTYSGGIVGANSISSNITDCYNKGKITSKDFVGGIVGGNITENSIINGCYNTEVVTHTNNMPTGGLAYNITDSVVTNCYNTSKVTGTSAPTGGLAYMITNSKLSNCYNLGDVECDNVAGGLAQSISNSTIIDCYNEGSVTSTYPAGGLAQTIGNSSIINSYNKGNVISNQSTAGGFATNISGSKVINCYNEGSVTGTYPAGGLTQAIYNSEVINFYNTGIINGNYGIGGIVQSSSDTTMKNCYYLNTSAEQGIYGKDDIKGIVEAKTAEEMKLELFTEQLNKNIKNIKSEIALFKWNYKENDYPELDKVSVKKEITITNTKAGKVIVHHLLEGTGPASKDENGVETIPAKLLAEDELLQGKIANEYTTSPNMKIEGYTLIKDESGEYVIPENASGDYTEEEQHVYYYYTKANLKLTVHHYLEGTEDKLAEDEEFYYNEGDHYKTNPSEEVLKSYELVSVVGDEEKDITQNEEVTYYYKIKKHEITTRVEIPEEELNSGRTVKGGNISGEGLAPYETVNYGDESIEDIIVKPDEGYRIKQIRLVSINEEGIKQESIIYINGKASEKEEIENAEITYNFNVDKSLTLTKFQNMTEDKEVIVVFEPDEGKLIVHHYIEGTTEKIYDDQVTIDLIGTEVETMPVRIEDYIVVGEPADRVGTITKQVQEKVYYYQKQYKVTTDIIKYQEPNENGEMEEVIGGTISGRGEASYEDILKGRNSRKEIAITPNEGFKITKITINGEEFDYSRLLQEDGSVTLEKEFFKNVDEDKHIEVEFKRKAKVIVHYLLKETGPEYDKEEVKLAEEDIIQGTVNGKYITTPNMDIKGYSLIKDENGEYIMPENKIGTFTKQDINVYYYYTKDPYELKVHHYLEGTKDKLADDEHYYYNEGEHYKVTPSKEVLKAYELVKVVGDEEKDITKNEEVIYYYKIKKYEIITRVEIPEEELNSGRTEKGGTISGEDEKTYETVEHGNASKEDIIITPDKGYKIKEVRLVSTKKEENEEESKKESIIYINADASEKEEKENAEITYTYNLDRSLILTKFENMTEDKEVIVVFEPVIGKVIVHHYIEGTTEKISEDQITEGLVGTEVQTDKVIKENYVLVQEPTNKNVEITEDTQELIYYYQKQYKVTTDIIKYEEPNSEGKMEEVIGGTISGKGEASYEDILKGRNNQKEIAITPKDGFEIVKITINGEELDYSNLLKEDGVVTLPKEFFKQVDKNKHVEVEFRRKTKVHVKYLEVGTKNVLAEEDLIEGFVGKEFKTQRKNILNYKTAKLETSEQGITNEKDQKVEPNGKMTKDEITIIYWYEKIPAGIIVKHVEKITTKTTNPETGKEEVKITGNLLDEEIISGYVGEKKETTRKEYKDYIPAENKEETKGINVSKEENSKQVTFKEDELIEVIYWYEKEFKITTDVIEHKEKVINPETGKEEIVNVKGGSISGEDEAEYEKVVRSNDSTKEIVIKPVDGYRIKQILINEKIMIIDGKVAEDGSITLKPEEGYFTNMQEDKMVKVEFEKIPATVIVKYKDSYTKESIAEDKIITGNVNDKYKEARLDIKGYVTAGPEPENGEGIMTEETITITYWYTKELKITTEVKEHEEKKVNSETGKEETVKVKGGNITGEDADIYEIVTRGNTSAKEIIIKPADGYRIKQLTINNKEIEIKDLVKEDNTIELPFFENMQEDKHIIVEFEKVPAKVIIKYLEEGTEKPIYKGEDGKEYEEIDGFIGDKYETKEKEIQYYELVKEKYPNNNNGIMKEEETTVTYYYKKLLFNMKVEKEIEKVTLNGQNMEITDKNKQKIEIKYKDLKETKLEITYKIKVTNTEEVEGVAVIEEIIPEGFEFVENEKTIWKEKDRKYTLTTEVINPGETKEYQITLKWNPEETNKGQKVNTAKIANTVNIPEYEETTKEDNEDTAIIEIKLNKTIEDVINMPKTGQERIVYIAAAIIAGACIGIMVWRKNKKSNKKNGNTGNNK